MPFFSIVIPLYNKENLIANTLHSALRQTFTDFEVIIINDGSTDDSENVATTLNDSRIIYRKTINQGVSKARNTAIEMATGKVIAFLDADDEWSINHLQELYNLYSDYPEAGMLVSRYTIRIGKGKIIHPVFKNIPIGYRGIVRDFFGESLIYRIATTSAVAIPKDILSGIGGFNENVTHPEDTELWIKIALKYPVAISSRVTMIYNFDLPESWSRKKMAGRKLMDFNQFAEEEKKNKSLKAFIDLYRIEYALKFRIEGDIKNSDKLYKNASPENIHYKTKLLFSLPPFVLRNALRFKHWLHKKGITFSVYN